VKKVFILGAGFSKDAGFPLQSQILSRWSGYNFLDYPPNLLETLQADRDKIQEFFKNIFAGFNPPLEDCFTLLDHSAQNKYFCKQYGWQDIEEIRATLTRALLFVFHHAGENIKKKEREGYDKIASYLLWCRVKAGQKNDEVSVISLNWSAPHRLDINPPVLG